MSCVIAWVSGSYDLQHECTVQVCKLNAFTECNDKGGSYHKLLIAEKEGQLHSCFVYTKRCEDSTCEAQNIV